MVYIWLKGVYFHKISFFQVYSVDGVYVNGFTKVYMVYIQVYMVYIAVKKLIFKLYSVYYHLLRAYRELTV